MVGARGFEPPTSCSRSRRANRAAPRPDSIRSSPRFRGRTGNLSTPSPARNVPPLTGLDGSSEAEATPAEDTSEADLDALLAGDDDTAEPAPEPAAAEAAKERMKQRIAESKSNYRKPTDLVKQRKDTTDYSCVSETGSPCPEGLVPRAIQREIVGVLEKLE